MSQCQRAYHLEVHHKRWDGPNSLANAEVLCPRCLAARDPFGIEPRPDVPFSFDVKEEALRRAGWQCECTSSGTCHNAEQAAPAAAYHWDKE